MKTAKSLRESLDMAHQSLNGTMSTAQALQLLDTMRSDDQKKHVVTQLTIGGAGLRGAVLSELSGLIIRLLKLEPEDFSIQTPLSDYGLDSIAATEIGNVFSRDFGISVPPTIFFEFQNLEGFIGYLLANHAAALSKKFAKSQSPNIIATEYLAPDPIRRPALMLAPAAQASARVVTAPDQRSECVTAPAEVPLSEADAPISIEDLWRNAEANIVKAGAPKATGGRPERLEPSIAILDACQEHVDQIQLRHLTRADGSIVEYAMYGRGKPALLIGGLAMHSSVMWRLQLARLGARYRLIMLHTPGAGNTDFYAGMTLRHSLMTLPPFSTTSACEIAFLSSDIHLAACCHKPLLSPIQTAFRRFAYASARRFLKALPTSRC